MALISLGREAKPARERAGITEEGSMNDAQREVVIAKLKAAKEARPHYVANVEAMRECLEQAEADLKRNDELIQKLGEGLEE